MGFASLDAGRKMAWRYSQLQEHDEEENGPLALRRGMELLSYLLRVECCV